MKILYLSGAAALAVLILASVAWLIEPDLVRGFLDGVLSAVMGPTARSIF